MCLPGRACKRVGLQKRKAAFAAFAENPGRCVRLLRSDPACLEELLAPVTGGEVGHFHVLAGARGVDELAVADIDADVVDMLAATAEEHQVAFDQRVGVADQLADVRHVARDARQFDAEALTEHVTDQTAAVETAFGAGAAPAIGRAEQRERALEHGSDAAFGRRSRQFIRAAARDLGGVEDVVDVLGERHAAARQRQRAAQRGVADGGEQAEFEGVLRCRCLDALLREYREAADGEQAGNEKTGLTADEAVDGGRAAGALGLGRHASCTLRKGAGIVPDHGREGVQISLDPGRKR